MSMDEIVIFERDMTPAELARMHAGFDENASDHGVEPQHSQRFGLVALVGVRFVGCISGLAYTNGEQFSGWFYLTDLFVEKEYRLKGIGAHLLQTLEQNLLQHRIHQIWTWTAGYEAPGFYQAHGYEVFVEMENWYPNGASRVGLRKSISQHGKKSS